MNLLLDFFQDHKTLVTTVTVISLIFVVASVLILPILIASIPDNYFLDEERQSRVGKKPTTALNRLFLPIKNILGIVLILLGIAMIVLPGQGILTILIGVSLTSFPGKYQLERKLITRPAIFKTINWIRHKAGKNSLQLPS